MKKPDDRIRSHPDRTRSHRNIFSRTLAGGWTFNHRPSFPSRLRVQLRVNSCKFVSGPLPARADSFGSRFLPLPIAPDSFGCTHLTTGPIRTYPQPSAPIRT